MIESMEAFEGKSYTCMKTLSRKFTGRDNMRHVLLCGGTGCLSSNSEEIYQKIKHLVEDLDMSDRIEVNQVGCFGMCSQGPFVKIFPEDTLYRLVTIEDAAEIVKTDLVKGEVVERLLYVDPNSGDRVQRQDDIPFYKKQKRIDS